MSFAANAASERPLLKKPWHTCSSPAKRARPENAATKMLFLTLSSYLEFLSKHSRVLGGCSWPHTGLHLIGGDCLFISQLPQT